MTVELTPDKLPKEMRFHTCAATQEAWARVADALAALTTENQTNAR